MDIPKFVTYPVVGAAVGFGFQYAHYLDKHQPLDYSGAGKTALVFAAGGLVALVVKSLWRGIDFGTGNENSPIDKR